MTKSRIVEDFEVDPEALKREIEQRRRAAQLWHRGVALESRYGMPEEYQRMRTMIDALPLKDREFVSAILCDSKVGCYRVMLKAAYSDVARRIGTTMETEFFRLYPNHGGITVVSADQKILCDLPAGDA